MVSSLCSLQLLCRELLVDNFMLNLQCFIRGESYSNIWLLCFDSVCDMWQNGSPDLGLLRTMSVILASKHNKIWHARPSLTLFTTYSLCVCYCLKRAPGSYFPETRKKSIYFKQKFMLLANKATMFCKVLNQFQIPIEVALAPSHPGKHSRVWSETNRGKFISVVANYWTHLVGPLDTSSYYPGEANIQ